MLDNIFCHPKDMLVYKLDYSWNINKTENKHLLHIFSILGFGNSLLS